VRKGGQNRADLTVSTMVARLREGGGTLRQRRLGGRAKKDGEKRGCHRGHNWQGKFEASARPHVAFSLDPRTKNLKKSEIKKRGVAKKREKKLEKDRRDGISSKHRFLTRSDIGKKRNHWGDLPGRRRKGSARRKGAFRRCRMQIVTKKA